MRAKLGRCGLLHVAGVPCSCGNQIAGDGDCGCHDEQLGADVQRWKDIWDALPAECRKDPLKCAAAGVPLPDGWEDVLNPAKPIRRAAIAIVVIAGAVLLLTQGGNRC